MSTCFKTAEDNDKSRIASLVEIKKKNKNETGKKVDLTFQERKK